MKNIEYFIWDFDGTLFNTYPAIAQTIVNLLKNKFEEHFQNKRKSFWSVITLISLLFLFLFPLFFYFSEIQLKQTNLQDCTTSVQVQYGSNAENITVESICTANNVSRSFIPRIIRIISQEDKLAPTFIFTAFFIINFIDFTTKYINHIDIDQA